MMGLAGRPMESEVQALLSSLRILAPLSILFGSIHKSAIDFA
jgi:hypothetical protein